MIDKTLSLNLGHTSNFPSHDIDVNMYSPSTDPKVAPWNRVMIAFAEFSKLQGRLYEELYSVRARRELPQVRSRTIEDLSSSFYAWHASFRQVTLHPVLNQQMLTAWLDQYHRCSMQQRPEHYHGFLRLYLLLRADYPLWRPDISSICHQNKLAALRSGAVELGMPCSELVETLPERYFEMWDILGLVSTPLLYIHSAFSHQRPLQ